MMKVSGIVLTMVLMGILSGCYHTSCQQPVPEPVNLKGEG